MGWETASRLRCPECGRVGWMTVVPGHRINDVKCPDCRTWFDKRGHAVPNEVPSVRGGAKPNSEPEL